MLSLKVLFLQSSGDFLTDELRAEVSDEKVWSRKMLKMYRSMRKLESRKYHGAHFAAEFKQLTSYFAVKHLLFPSDTGTNADGLSAFSDVISKMSSAKGSPSPRAFQNKKAGASMMTSSQSPTRSNKLSFTMRATQPTPLRDNKDPYNPHNPRSNQKATLNTATKADATYKNSTFSPSQSKKSSPQHRNHRSSANSLNRATMDELQMHDARDSHRK